MPEQLYLYMFITTDGNGRKFRTGVIAPSKSEAESLLPSDIVHSELRQQLAMANPNSTKGVTYHTAID